MIQTAEELAASQGVAAACAVLAVPRSSLYRARPLAPDVALFGARGVVFEADAVTNLLQELFGAGFHGFFQWFAESWGGVILVGKMAKRSILKPNAFRLLPQPCFRKIFPQRGLCGEVSA